jgi:sterol desaturase/sphingolipid hydroxylase (fatty acid hydroxylase superfamily)
MGRKRLSWLAIPIAAGAFLLLAWLERRRPLRCNVEPKLRRQTRNLVIAGIGTLVIQFAETPVVQPLAGMVERRRWGLLRRVPLPLWLEIAAALLLMDYTMYIWHVLTHRLPFLWRFHLVHHVDLDLDASTALRFHFGELVTSMPWRAAQVVLIGITPLTYSVWQTIFFLSILFHHSDVQLPIEWERCLNRFIVTPRMHGIHHSVVHEETDSNWSSGLTMWDRLHGTLRLNVPQEAVTIGLAAYRKPVTLPKALAMPFRRGPDVWRLPDGRYPLPHFAKSAPQRLLP